MIKVEKFDIWGFEHAVRGMRNPMNSWDKSDSHFEIDCDSRDCDYADQYRYSIGPKDLELMQKLYSAGTEHRKFLRQIFVSVDITAPLYWWKEFDTYKVGTVSNSCSTMHKIAAKEFTLEDFSCEHLGVYNNEHTDFETATDVGGGGNFLYPIDVLTDIIEMLNHNRKKFLETKDKKYWWQMIQLLPSSYNQKRTITMNYENVMSIINQRNEHKLDEWRQFVGILRTFPYVEGIRNDASSINTVVS